jgi:hypothetical protein
MTLRIDDSVVGLHEEVGDKFIRVDQHISDDFLDSLKSERMWSASQKANDYHRVASVPVALYDIWIRQGLDPYRWSAKQLIAKLNADGLDAFITSNKAL